LKLSDKKRAALAAADGGAALAIDQELLADNLRYFGEPVYEYTLQQGIEDGYLAPPEIFTFDLFHDGKKTPERLSRISAADLAKKKVTNAATGAVSLPARPSYGPSDLEKRLLLPERVAACAQHLFQQLLAHGGAPEQKTIVFCATDWHAQAFASQLNTLYADWCSANGHVLKDSFAFQCTQKSGGAAFVSDLRKSVSSHFIACTVELLSTGVDVPCVRNIVFLKYVTSPIAFHQMLGRGTRLDPETDKLMFRVYDYTDATDLLGDDFLVKPRSVARRLRPGPKPPPPHVVEGVQIVITDTGRYLTATVDGRTQRIAVEDYRRLMAARLIAVAPDVALFRSKWIKPAERRTLIDAIVQAGLSPRALQLADETTDSDLFDVLGELAYGLLRRTRPDRAYAFTYKQAPWLQTLPAASAATVKAIASQFGRGGTEALETPQIFSTPEVMKAGGLDALKLIGKPADVLEQTKEKIFAA
jgi:type I restriction enzyme R subunit